LSPRARWVGRYWSVTIVGDITRAVVRSSLRVHPPGGSRSHRLLSVTVVPRGAPRGELDQNGINVKAGYGRRMAGIASIGALALVLAACSGDDNGNGNGNGNGADTDNGAQTEENANGNGNGGGNGIAALSGNLTGSGASSFQLAIQEWQIEFPELTDGAVVDYNAVGSGTGRAEFLSEAVD